MIYGLLGSISLLVFYFFIMSLGKNSFSSAFEQLVMLRLWISPLVVTFGIEIGLFSYVKSVRRVSGKSTMVSGATSGVAMVACCAHHVTDILPLVGFSLLATVLTTYQPLFFVLGIVSNLIAIFLSLRNLPMKEETKKKLITATIILSPVVILAVGYLLITPVDNTSSMNTTTQAAQSYQPQENDDKQVTVVVTPQSLSSSQQVVFQIAMNNHMYDLSNDLAKTAALKDDQGNTYKPISWNGTTGGHHVLGQLIFPQLSNNASQITLTLPGIAGVDRVFNWKL